MVEDVVELRAEFQLRVLCQGERLCGADIDLPRAGSAKQVTRGVAEFSSRESKRCRPSKISRRDYKIVTLRIKVSWLIRIAIFCSGPNKSLCSDQIVSQKEISTSRPYKCVEVRARPSVTRSPRTSCSDPATDGSASWFDVGGCREPLGCYQLVAVRY
jgi:hypothetical protein